MTSFELHPHDTLFFRDARPMEAGIGSGGHGANWPLPTTLHQALRTTLLRMTKDDLRDGKTRRGHNDTKIMSEAFRSLRSIGPFPMRNNEVYLPRPLDLLATEDGVTYLNPLQTSVGSSNMPAPWLQALMPAGRVGKKQLSPWIPISLFKEVLSGKSVKVGEKHDLYHTEHRIGISINDGTTTVEDGALYSSQHLRMAEDVALWCSAKLSDTRNEENRGLTVDAIAGSNITLGGEGRLTLALKTNAKLDIPEPTPTKHVKWVLATPAVFKAGWRPSWVQEEDGQVLIARDADRKNGESRGVWRDRLTEKTKAGDFIHARMVAACIGKAQHFSGWDLGTQGPKPTQLAVPAGSVFYFEAGSNEAAAELIAALHNKTRSDNFGEKGMGLGFCGTWKPVDVAGRPIN